LFKVSKVSISFFQRFFYKVFSKVFKVSEGFQSFPTFLSKAFAVCPKHFLFKAFAVCSRHLQFKAFPVQGIPCGTKHAIWNLCSFDLELVFF